MLVRGWSWKIDLIKPNPIKIGTLVKTIPKVRAWPPRSCMEGAGDAQTYRKVTHVEKCGLARVESVVDLIGCKLIKDTVGQ